MTKIGTLAVRIEPMAYTALRVVAGAMFAVHGAQKILGWHSEFMPPAGSQLWIGGLIELIGGVVTTSHWLADSSLFHQMAAAPAVNPDWTTAAATVGIGAVCGGVGALALHLRDVQGE